MRIPKNLITNIKVRPSLPFGECLAKTWNNGRTVCGRTVESHCRIAGNVAEILIYRFNQLVLNFLPNEAFIPALLHDIGKVCPTFQKKLRNAIDNIDVKKEIPELAGVDPEVGEFSFQVQDLRRSCGVLQRSIPVPFSTRGPSSAGCLSGTLPSSISHAD